MLRERPNTWRRVNLLGDLLLTGAALASALLHFRPPLTIHTALLLFLLTFGLWGVFLYGPAGSYFYRLKSARQILKELLWAMGRSFLAFTAIVYFLDFAFPGAMVLLFFAIDTVLLTLFRLSLLAFLHHYRARGRSNRNLLVVGSGPKARDLADRISDNKNWGLHILGFLDYHRTGLWRYRDIPLIGHPDGLSDIIAHNQVDYVVIAVDKRDLPLTDHTFAVSEEMGVMVCVLADYYFHPISRPSATHFLDMPAVVYTSAPTARMPLAVKSCLDRIGGLIGVIISLPLALTAALAIKVEDGGPVLFRQTRSGKNGKPFTMFKFRTMVKNAEQIKSALQAKNEMSGPVFKMKRDPRVTRIGALLRKSSLDEIPQFFNVLRGDMSLVGPRPPLPTEVARYNRWQRRKLSVKPGLTCLWQINGRNQIDFDDWMKLDLDYIDNWSLWLDTKILLKTVPAVFKGDGAQ